MTLKSERDGSTLRIAIAGRLDTTSAPELENVLKSSLDDVSLLILDCEEMEYISSAGLRILLSAYKQMQKKGEMKLTNVSEENMDVFSLTGYTEFLTFE